MTVCLSILGLLLSLQAAQAKVEITKIDYKGWTDCYRLANGTVEIVIVPQIARIMRYGFVDGDNILWENKTLSGKPANLKPGEWTNFGGDKVWPWSQDDWPKHIGANWPPPVEADQTAHTATVVGKETVRLVSPTLKAFGVRIVRDIRLAPTGTAVTINSRLERTDNDADFLLSAWSIMQIPPPSLLIVRRTADSTLANGWKKMGDGEWKRLENPSNDLLLIERPIDHSGKLGFDGDVLGAILHNGDTLLTITSRTAKEKGYVPGDAAQLYTQQDAPDTVPGGVTGYVEMEMTAPRKTLKKGEQSELVTVWELHKLTTAQRDEKVLGALVRSMK